MITLFILLCLTIASVSYTIAITSIFTWLRDLVSPIHIKIEQLIHCPYCLGHYVALFFILITGYRIEVIHPIVDFIITWFSIMGGTSIIHYFIIQAYEPIAKAEVIRQLKKQQQN